MVSVNLLRGSSAQGADKPEAPEKNEDKAPSQAGVQPSVLGQTSQSSSAPVVSFSTESRILARSLEDDPSGDTSDETDGAGDRDPGPEGTTGAPDGGDTGDDDAESPDTGSRTGLAGIGRSDVSDLVSILTGNGSSAESDDATDEGDDANASDGDRTNDAGDVLVYEAPGPDGEPNGHDEAVANAVENNTDGDNEGEIITEFIEPGDISEANDELFAQFEDGDITYEEYLQQFIALDAAAVVDDTSARVEEALDDPDDETRVLNISAGLSLTGYVGSYDPDAPDGPGLASAVAADEDFQEAVFGRTLDDPNALNVNSEDFDAEAYSQLLAFTRDSLQAEGSAFQESVDNYQSVTERAADEGLTVVVAAGNEHDELVNQADLGVEVEQGDDFNFLGLSDHVVSVAASDDATGEIAFFSSGGTAADNPFGPTVAINGVDEESVGDEFFVEGDSGTDTGTSFAAPQISALIHEMLEQNPDLTYDEIVELLQSGAEDTEFPDAAEGAGIITDPDAIIGSVEVPQAA